MTDQELTIRKFKKEDYSIYKKWFSNAHLNATLGGIDQEWLDYILSEKDGEELAVIQNNQLVSVLGIVFPNKQHPTYIITNIAVDPKLKHNGLGTRVIELLMKHYKLGDNEYWACFVEKSNTEAQHFFEKNNWKQIAQKNDEAMIWYEYRSPN